MGMSTYRRTQLEQPYILRRRDAYPPRRPGQMRMPQPWRPVSRHATQADAEAALLQIPVDPQFRLGVFRHHQQVAGDPRVPSPLVPA